MIDLKKLDAIQKILKRVAALSLVLFVALIAFSGYQLYSINRQIAEKSKELDDKIKWIKQKDDELAAKQAQLDALEKRYETLNNLYGKTVDADPEIAKQTAVKIIEANPRTAQATIDVLEANPRTARILPRVYIQIKDESQRPKARETADKLKAGGFIAPGIENVAEKSPAKTELRYFNQGDATSGDVRNIVSILNGENIKVEEKFIKTDEQVVRGNGTANKIRARHYELWFGADFPPPVRPPLRLPGVGKVDQPLRVKPVQ